jgi:hypothetical protein
MKTTIINIYGGPGSGKSTLAAELYAWMKIQGYSVELVREAIKTWSWAGKKLSVFEQIYITNQQMLLETDLYGKVDYLITDSPIALGAFYCNYYHGSAALDNLNRQIKLEGKIKGLIEDPINFYLPIQDSIYKEEGRYSSLEEAKSIDKKLSEFLKMNDLRTLNGAVSNRKISTIEFILKRHAS